MIGSRRASSMRSARSTLSVMSSSLSTPNGVEVSRSRRPVDLAGEEEVGVEEVAARHQHPPHLVKEAVAVGIAMGRLHVQHRVEGGVAEGQRLGVAREEAEPGHRAVESARQGHRARRQLHAERHPRAERPLDVRQPAAAARAPPPAGSCPRGPPCRPRSPRGDRAARGAPRRSRRPGPTTRNRNS